MTKPLTTVVLYAGPGTGKSTTTSQVFAALKQLGYNVEIAHEYAKDLTWESAWGKLRHQPYVAAKQMWRLDRLRDQVEAVITDTSTLLGLVYGEQTAERGMTPAFSNWLVDDYKRRNTLNIFLERDDRRGYNTSGRTQTEAEAKQADAKIRDLLDTLSIPYHTVAMDVENNAHVDEVVKLACRAIDRDKLTSGMVPGT